MRMLAELARALRAKPWPPELPRVVQFPVNDICDARCQMCNIWQQKLDQQVSPDEVRRIFASPLFRRVGAVGLNGGEPTLRRDLDQLAAALFDALPRLRDVSLITNGLHAARVVGQVEALARTVHARGGRLDVMLSLDGVGAVHDRVRGCEGNFESALRVLDHLLASGVADSLRVGCTVIRDNVFHVHELLEFCKARGVYVKFRLGVPHRRLYNLTPPPPKQIGKRVWLFTRPFDLDEDARLHFAEFLRGLVEDYEPSFLQRRFYRSLIGQLVEDRPRSAGCDWQHRGVTLSSRGELMYCAVQSRSLGDARTADPQALYFGNAGYLKEIVATKCASCAHDYVGIAGAGELLGQRVHEALRLAGIDPLRAHESTPARSLHALRRAIFAPAAFARARRRIEALGRAAGAGGASSGAMICGWYGTETQGDKAILAGVVEALRRAGHGGRLTLASLNPFLSRQTCRQMPELAGLSVCDIDEAARQIGRHSLLVFGGGPLMAVDELAPMEALFRLAREARVPSLVAGCGVGPLGARRHNDAIGAILGLAFARIFRDAGSRDTARSLGIDTGGDAVCEDPAYLWLRRCAASLPRPPGRAVAPALALALRRWPWEQYAARLGVRAAQRMAGRFEEALLDALEALTRASDLRLLPAPFCSHHFGGDDRRYLRSLLGRRSALRARLDTALLSREPAPDELLRQLQACDAIVAMRYHSAVFAHAIGLRALVVDYTLGEGKTASLARAAELACIRPDSASATGIAEALQALLAGPAARPAAHPSPDFAEVLAQALRPLDTAEPRAAAARAA